MKRITGQDLRGAPALALLLAACSSGGDTTGATTGSGGASTSSASSASSSTSSTASTASGSTTSSSAGTGGAAACPDCVIVAALPNGSKPYGLFADGTNVYWTNSQSGEVMQAKADGTAVVTLATGEDTPIAVQVRDGFVYWVSYSIASVMRKTPIGGGPVTDLTPAPAARELLIGKDYLFWTREPDDIQRIPAAGLEDGGTADLLTNNLLSNGLTGDDANLFWVNRQDGNVKKSDLALGNEVALAVGDVPWDIVVDDTSVYWTEQGSAPNSGKVMRASKVDGAGATVLASGQGSPAGIATDGARVYWANQAAGTISAVPLGGGAVTVLASGQAKPVNVAVDAVSVYWANTAGNAIVKVAKQAAP